MQTEKKHSEGLPARGELFKTKEQLCLPELDVQVVQPEPRPAAQPIYRPADLPDKPSGTSFEQYMQLRHMMDAERYSDTSSDLTVKQVLRENVLPILNQAGSPSRRPGLGGALAELCEMISWSVCGVSVLCVFVFAAVMNVFLSVFEATFSSFPTLLIASTSLVAVGVLFLLETPNKASLLAITCAIVRAIVIAAEYFRQKPAKKNLRRATTDILALTAAVWIGLGVWLAWNTYFSGRSVMDPRWAVTQVRIAYKTVLVCLAPAIMVSNAIFGHQLAGKNADKAHESLIPLMIIGTSMLTFTGLSRYHSLSHLTSFLVFLYMALGSFACAVKFTRDPVTNKRVLMKKDVVFFFLMGCFTSAMTYLSLYLYTRTPEQMYAMDLALESFLLDTLSGVFGKNSPVFIQGAKLIRYMGGASSVSGLGDKNEAGQGVYAKISAFLQHAFSSVSGRAPQAPQNAVSRGSALSVFYR